jgi:transcriptional regulator with XRE-family HTH domain
VSEGREDRGLDYGGLIRRLRADRGLTMEGLAESAGISTSYLSEVERGLKRPSTDVVAKIAEALEMRASEFLELAEMGLEPKQILHELRVASPRRRALYLTRPSMSLDVKRAVEAPAAREDLIEALVSVSRQLNDEDLGILIDLARKLGRPKK